VLAYNWLVRRNKSVMEDLAAFTNDLHGYIMSDGSVKPRFGGEKSSSGSRGGPSTTTAGNPGGRQPVRTGATQTGAETPTA
jgi:biopolymer transport protein ExbB